MNPFDKHFGPEDQLHIACCNYLDLQYPNILYTHPANEAKRTPFERYKAQKLRMKPGCPDLLIFEPRGDRNGLAIEFKAKGNKYTPKQKDWLDSLIARNWECWVIYDLDLFMKVLNDYLKAPNTSSS